MEAVKIDRIVDDALLALLPELTPWRGGRVRLVALPETIEDLPEPPRRLPRGAALGLLAGLKIEAGDERGLLEEARREKYE
jgi:hypothetical protein